MAKSKKPAAKPSKPQDAVALLKADHKQVKTWFQEFQGARSANKKQMLATNICKR